MDLENSSSGNRRIAYPVGVNKDGKWVNPGALIRRLTEPAKIEKILNIPTAIPKQEPPDKATEEPPSPAAPIKPNATTEITTTDPEPGSDDRVEEEYVSGNPISPTTIKSLEQELAVLPPMTLETDELLYRYFIYMTEEYKKLHRGITYPIVFYTGTANNETELKDLLEQSSQASRTLVRARGRYNMGQSGDWFWNTSEVEELGEAFHEHAKACAAARKNI